MGDLRRYVGYAFDLGLGAGLALITWYVVRPYWGAHAALVLGAAVGAGVSSGLSARREGRRRLLHALLAAGGAALGIYLGMRWFG